METNPWFQTETFWSTVLPVMFHRKRVMNTSNEVQELIALLDVQAPSKVLDLCCGFGRHALEFAKRGFVVTGVDITEPYLAIAQKNAQRKQLSIDYVHADIRQFCRPNQYDLIVNLFHSFGYFDKREDDRRVLTNAYQSLVPGGRLVIELISKEIVATNFREREWLEYDGYQVLTTGKISQNWSWMDNTWTVLKDQQVQEFSYSHRLYSAIELQTLLLQTGFQQVAIYQDFAGSPFDVHAQQLVIVATK